MLHAMLQAKDSTAVIPVVEAMKRYPSNNTIALHGNHAMWGLGNNPRNRLALISFPGSFDVLQASSGCVSSTLQ